MITKYGEVEDFDAVVCLIDKLNRYAKNSFSGNYILTNTVNSVVKRFEQTNSKELEDGWFTYSSSGCGLILLNASSPKVSFQVGKIIVKTREINIRALFDPTGNPASYYEKILEKI